MTICKKIIARGTKSGKKKERRGIKERMISIASIFMDKTEQRLKKETIISGKTLKMVSLSETLFSVISTWK